MKKLFIIVSFTLISIAAYCNKVDSLYRQLNIAKEDTSKIRLLIVLQKYYATKDFDSSLYYLEKTTALSKKLNTSFFDFYINVGYMEYYYYHNNYKKAIALALKNKDIAEKENDIIKMTKSYNNLASVYNHFGLHKYAIEYILKCLSISEKTKDSVSFAIRNLTASNAFYNIKQYDKAVEYAKKSIQYGKQFNNMFAVMMAMGNLSAMYSDLNKIDSAIYLDIQHLKLAQEQKDIVQINYALINLCFDYYKVGNEKMLASYAAELNKYKYTQQDSQTLAQIYNAMALNYIGQKQYMQAKMQLDSGIYICINQSNNDALGNLYQTYATLNYLQGNIKDGNNYTFKYDSLISALNLKELNFYTEELETKYNTEKKEIEILQQQQQLHKRNIWILFLISFLIGLILVSYFIYRYFKQRNYLLEQEKIIQQQQINELEKEKQLQATEAVLKGQEDERSRIAKDLHDGLGGLLSSVKYSLNDMKENVILSADNASAFTRSIDMLDSGIQELRRIAHNMMPENLVKFGLDKALNDYCKSISSTNVITVNYTSLKMQQYKNDINININIYRVIQELINNTIKHANASEILVQLSKDENILHITVEDNGKGFDVNAIKSFKGAGWTNIQNRINYLKGKLNIDSNSQEGTSVTIEIPLT